MLQQAAQLSLDCLLHILETKWTALEHTQTDISYTLKGAKKSRKLIHSAVHCVHVYECRDQLRCIGLMVNTLQGLTQGSYTLCLAYNVVTLLRRF